MPSIDVVVRTAGAAERLASLQRAIESIAAQRDVHARPIVLLGGERPAAAAAIAERLAAVVHVPGAPTSPGRALALGRRLVAAPFHAFLDDDDELLPHALAVRVACMEAHPEADVVVTSGLRIVDGKRHVDLPDLSRHAGDLLNGIIERCWLPSCAGLFRTSAIGADLFEDLPDLCEWTAVAFRLATRRTEIAFLDTPSYVIHDTPNSASKSDAFLQATLRVLRAMRAHPMPPAARARLERKYRTALHDAAEHYRRSGHVANAWACHLRSMKPPFTLRYGAYTRKLLWAPREPR
jgi:hypothetical protein